MDLRQSEVGAVLAVSDMERAKEFYEGKLGLEPEADASEEMRSYRCGGGTGINVYLSPEHAGKSTATLASWGVDDVERVVDGLNSRGITSSATTKGQS